MQEIDTEIRQSQFIFSETKMKPFMTLFPSTNRQIWWTYPLKENETINKGSKLFVKPIGGLFVPRYKIYIASIGE